VPYRLKKMEGIPIRRFDVRSSSRREGGLPPNEGGNLWEGQPFSPDLQKRGEEKGSGSARTLGKRRMTLSRRGFAFRRSSYFGAETRTEEKGSGSMSPNGLIEKILGGSGSNRVKKIVAGGKRS